MTVNQTLKYSDYESPEAISGDKNITHTQKMAMLEAWAEDAQAKAGAASEDLAAPEDGDGKDQNSLQRVRQVLSELESYGSTA